MTMGTARSTMTLEDGLYLFALQRKLVAKQGMRMNRGNPPDRSAASAWRLGWLPLAAGLLPAVGVVIAFSLAVTEGQFAGCNPLLEGCVSISRAARHGLGNILFRSFLLPAAVLQAAVWCLAPAWLRTVDPDARRLAWVPWLGVAAALFLILYGSFLGTEGAGYRWMRRYGVIFYFGFTAILMLGLGGAVRRSAQAAAGLGYWPALLLASVIALPLAGAINSLAPLLMTDAEALDRFENATEWWAGLAFTVYFVILALLWRRTGCAVRMQRGGS